jgi:hypothetical protein
MLLTALLGALGSVAVNAQTNVYSLNAVGYINVTCVPGFNMISCPLITSPDNTIGTLINNSNGAYTACQVWFYSPSSGYNEDIAAPKSGRGSTTNADGWQNAGTNVLSPGVACWFNNTLGSNITLTFVGTVPSGTTTNTMVTGFNLVSSVLPMSGDIVTNPLSMLTNYNINDNIWTYTPSGGYVEYISGSGARFQGTGYLNQWEVPLGDPVVPNVGQGFWYQNKGAAVNWVENFTL